MMGRLKREETDWCYLLAMLHTVLDQHTAQCLYPFILSSLPSSDLLRLPLFFFFVIFCFFESSFPSFLFILSFTILYYIVQSDVSPHFYSLSLSLSLSVSPHLSLSLSFSVPLSVCLSTICSAQC